MFIPNVSYHSFRGHRDVNEDAYGIPKQAHLFSTPCVRGTVFTHTDDVFAEKGYLFLLADGVGGVAGGEIASSTVVADVGARYYSDPSMDISVSLRRTIQASNRQLRRFRENHQFAKKMATTLVAAVCFNDWLHIASVGDSRAYLITDSEARCLTIDHSWVQETQNSSTTTLDPSIFSFRRHHITRSIGSQNQVGVDTFRLNINSGNRILLCTDGLSNYLDEKTIFFLSRCQNLQTAVDNLIDTAYEQGSTDNISAILIEPLPSNTAHQIVSAIDKRMP